MKQFKTLKNYALYILLFVCVFIGVYSTIAFIETEFNIFKWQTDLYFMGLTLAIFTAFGFCGCLFLAINK